ncbi:DNA-binding IclR family transcriptional regulator [Paraburkholderia sp. BL9I2N2]|nr:DNA-binding IclR family transcriptional regulator [Paraburkholderia sp. BL9I2N2]
MARPERHVFACNQNRPPQHPRVVCAGRKGSTALLKAFWAEQQKRQAPDTVAITYSGCLGPCDQGTNVLIYPDAVLYSGVTMADVEKIFTRQLEGREPVRRLIEGLHGAPAEQIDAVLWSVTLTSPRSLAAYYLLNKFHAGRRELDEAEHAAYLGLKAAAHAAGLNEDWQMVQAGDANFHAPDPARSRPLLAVHAKGARLHRPAARRTRNRNTVDHTTTTARSGGPPRLRRSGSVAATVRLRRSTMSKQPANASLADDNLAAGGVAAVDRALTLLAAFGNGTHVLSLSALAERTRLYKSTVLRLLASLEHAHLVVRRADGCYVLGSGVARLHAVYAQSSSSESLVIPVLQELVAATRESAAFHVRQGAQRLCLYRVDSPQPVRDHIRAGELLPLDRGTGGRVLQAYCHEGDEALGQQIRRQQVIALAGDRDPQLAGIAAPVFGPSGQLAGVITLTMPRERLDSAWAEIVRNSGRTLTRYLGGIKPGEADG